MSYLTPSIHATANQKWEMIRSSTPLDVQAEEAKNLINRILPDHHQLFKIQIEGPSFAPKNKDRVTLVSEDSAPEHLETIERGNNLTTILVTANLGNKSLS